MTDRNHKFFRKRRICYWDQEKLRVTGWKSHFEKTLKFLPNLDFYQLRSLDDPNFAPCDLLIVTALSVPEQEISSWINSLQSRIKAQGKIWTPALVLSEVNYSKLGEWLHEYANLNWYFDILHPDHLDSVPIRIANLLRIHDHLHELERYHDQVMTMQKQIDAIELKLEQALRASSAKSN